ncbi:MAG TPA: carboxypeptidase-like regulatory domain-containing protein [Yeosuana sp.]
MRKLLLLLFVLPTIILGQVTMAEGLKKEIIIEGNVRDLNGMPLNDATLLVKGFSNVIKTNFDGNFDLKVNEGAVLIISCAGFKTKEITVGNEININITLEEEVDSKIKRSLTVSEIRKQRREARRKKHDAQSGKNVNTLDLKDEMLKAAGRSVKGAIRRNRNN